MKQDYSNQELQVKAIEYRKALLKYIKIANAGHTGGDLSCIDILNVLYNDILNVSPSSINDPKRDRYIQSKGHAVEALYVVLAGSGFFKASDLETMGQYKSHYIGHPTKKVPGVEQNTGALGHGLPIASGIALSGKKDGANFRVFTLLGDGEMAEGSNWEAAMFAGHYQLDNLVAIIDHNTLQITGMVQNVMRSNPYKDKFEAFGWAVTEMDGHRIPEIREKLYITPIQAGKPTLIVANTVKGKGISFMEGKRKWHHKVPTDAEMEIAYTELEQALEEISRL